MFDPDDVDWTPAARFARRFGDSVYGYEVTRSPTHGFQLAWSSIAADGTPSALELIDPRP